MLYRVPVKLLAFVHDVSNICLLFQPSIAEPASWWMEIRTLNKILFFNSLLSSSFCCSDVKQLVQDLKSDIHTKTNPHMYNSCIQKFYKLYSSKLVAESEMNNLWYIQLM